MSLSDDDVYALFALRTELPSVRESVRLARLLDTPEVTNSLNPILPFVADKVASGVIENLLLRAQEIAEVLDRAYKAEMSRSLFSGAGRGRKALDPILQDAIHFRNVNIAHRVKLRSGVRALREKVIQEYGSFWAFAEALLGAIHHLLGPLDSVISSRAAGMEAPARMYRPFTRDDVRELAEVANGLGIALRYGEKAR